MTLDGAANKVRSAYQAGGYREGWRLLVSSRDSWYEYNGIMVAGINPGASSPSDEGLVASANNNGYLFENWRGDQKSPLQRKVFELFVGVAKRLGHHEMLGVRLLENALCTNYIPFASRSVATLHRPEYADGFASTFWDDAFQWVQPLVVLSIGYGPYTMWSHFASSLITHHHVQVGRNSVHHGQASRYGMISPYIVAVPHLSHWASHCDAPELVDAVAVSIAKRIALHV